MSPPPKFFLSKFREYISKLTFLVNLNQLFYFTKKIEFGGKISISRFLGFFEKNLKPKKFILGGKKSKNQKSKGVF
jgi:hypothetical protein